MFVVMIRIFQQIGVLPLWDNELVNFWLRVPTHLRQKRYLYYKCIAHEQLPTANNPTLTQLCGGYLKDKAMWLVEALYPIRKGWEYFSNEEKVFLGGPYLFFKILFLTKGYRTESTTLTVYYILHEVYGASIQPFKEYIQI